jgi:hypothetical protein
MQEGEGNCLAVVSRDNPCSSGSHRNMPHCQSIQVLSFLQVIGTSTNRVDDLLRTAEAADHCRHGVGANEISYRDGSKVETGIN